MKGHDGVSMLGSLTRLSIASNLFVLQNYVRFANKTPMFS